MADKTGKGGNRENPKKKRKKRKWEVKGEQLGGKKKARGREIILDRR